MAGAMIGRQAVVIGAGMSGLAAAAALSDYFEQVVVLERDALPANAIPRPGAPQGRHLHALLAGGQRALGDLFPGFEQDLADAGAVPNRIALDTRIEVPGYDPLPQRDLGLQVYSMSRPLIEMVVRQRAQGLANVELRARSRVRDLVLATNGTAVSAVRCENADGNIETLLADLVVDASGRGTIVHGVLETVGRPAPEETSIGVDIGYATAIFSLRDDAPADWQVSLLLPRAPETSRGAFMVRIEGQDRWIVTLAGRYDEKPPGDADAFLRFAEQLRTPTVYHAIRRAERLGEIVRYGFPASVWRHFEWLATFPRGLLPFGDAICRFNPVWGQGMSVAAQEAVALRRLLGGSRQGAGDPLAELAPAFFAEASELIETPWTMAAIPDFAMPQTQGERPPDLETRLKSGAALMQLAAEDSAVHRVMVAVRNLLEPSSALRHPELVARIEAVMAQQAA
jgi:2-polyprenyl-6-methoxyphenol hydroxylase-like FAD-dependent oxidoreductase